MVQAEISQTPSGIGMVLAVVASVSKIAVFGAEIWGVDVENSVIWRMNLLDSAPGEL